MKWVLVKHPYTAVQKFQLEDNNVVKAVLKFNQNQQSARINTGKEQKLFFLERSGIWNNKIIFKSGYGIERGKLSFDKNFHAGTVELEHKKFQFTIQDSPKPVLVIYEHHHSTPLVTCQLESDGENLYDVVPEERDLEQEYASLLLGLCWVLNAATEKESQVFVPIYTNH